MRAIDRSLVDAAWREVAAYPPGRADAEAQAFLGGQPHVAAYLDRTLGSQPSEVKGAAFGLAFLLFKVLERSLGRPFPEVQAARIDEAQAAMTDWLEAQSIPAMDALGSAEAGHPTLVRYIVDVFYGDAPPPGATAENAGHPAAGAGYDTGVRARLTLVLRTLALALDVGEVVPGG